LFFLAPTVAVTYSYLTKRTKLFFRPNVKFELSPKDKEFVKLVNDYRLSMGLNALIPEKLACEICARDLEIYNPPTHYGDGKRRKDSKAEIYSEIVARNYGTPTSTFYAYLNSPDHKETIESDLFTHIGTS